MAGYADRSIIYIPSMSIIWVVVGFICPHFKKPQKHINDVDGYGWGKAAFSLTGQNWDVWAQSYCIIWSTWTSSALCIWDFSGGCLYRLPSGLIPESSDLLTPPLLRDTLCFFTMPGMGDGWALVAVIPPLYHVSACICGVFEDTFSQGVCLHNCVNHS